MPALQAEIPEYQEDQGRILLPELFEEIVSDMNAQLSLCFGSMSLVAVVTLVITTRILLRTLAAQKMANQQEAMRLQAEADDLTAWREYQKTIKPSPSRGYVTPESQAVYNENKRRREAERTLANSPRITRQIRGWSESSGEIIDPSGNALVARGNDGKLYNMQELADHFGRIFRHGDQKTNMMWAEVYLQHFTHPSNLTPVSLSESEIAEYSEYNAMGRGLALAAGYEQSSVGSNHHAVQFQVSDYCNGLPRM